MNLYLLVATETKRYYVTTKHLNLNFPQQRNLKVYSRWLWIFLSLKSPEEWAITKQACRDESAVFFLFPVFIYKYIYTYIQLKIIKTKSRSRDYIMMLKLSKMYLHVFVRLRWLDWIFWGWYLPSLSSNYVGMSKGMEKKLPQLYYIKMKISYDLGFIAIGVAMAT